MYPPGPACQPQHPAIGQDHRPRPHRRRRIGRRGFQRVGLAFCRADRAADGIVCQIGRNPAQIGGVQHLHRHAERAVHGGLGGHRLHLGLGRGHKQSARQPHIQINAQLVRQVQPHGLRGVQQPQRRAIRPCPTLAQADKLGVLQLHMNRPRVGARGLSVQIPRLGQHHGHAIARQIVRASRPGQTATNHQDIGFHLHP